MKQLNSMRQLCVFVGAVVVIMSVNSCKSLESTTLIPQMKNQQLLPNLTPIFDEMSFGSVFPLAHTQGSVFMTEYGYGATYSSTTANPAFNDIKTIFERDLENISQISGAPKGSIRCRAIDGKSKDGKHRMSVEAFSLAVASGLTLCTANLVGMPISCSKSKLQIEVTILDSNNNVIGRYISDFHKSKSYVAMYWGYSLAQAPRKDARYVFTACMEDIKYQIEKDYTRLTEALK